MEEREREGERGRERERGGEEGETRRGDEERDTSLQLLISHSRLYIHNV